MRLLFTFALVLCLSSALLAQGDLILNEFTYDPPSGGSEFVELFNRSTQTYDLANLSLADARLKPVSITPTSRPFLPDTYLVLVQDSLSFSTQFPGVPFIEVPKWPALNNSGDEVILQVAGVTVDSLRYEADWGGRDRSLERRDPDQPSTASFNWISSPDPTGGTPGQQNAAYGPDHTPPSVRFVDQQVQDQLTVFLTEPPAVEDLDASQFFLDDGQTARFVEYHEADTTLRVGFDMSIRARALVIQRLTDRVGNGSPEQIHDIARAPEPGDLVLNEILYDPLADAFDARPDQAEYVELLNTSSTPITLRNLYWTGPVDEEGKSDTLYLTRQPLSLATGGYAVVFASQGGQPPDQGVQLPINRTTLSLDNQGDLLHLHRPDHIRLESVAYRPDWHTPNLTTTRGTSLERVTPDGSFWTSSTDPSGGTPGRPNSVELQPTDDSDQRALVITPQVFSPDGDGFDDVVGIHFRLPVASAQIRVLVFDAAGRRVRTLEEARFTGPTGVVIWNGLDDRQHPARVGLYVVLIEAVDIESGTVNRFKAPVVLAKSL